jgi:hypothetical protein
MNDEIQRIISGESQVRYGTNIHAAIRYLREGEKSGALDKSGKYFKREETERLKKYIAEQNLWVKDIDLTHYISEGIEQRVYLKDSKSVIKLNDTIYYLSWTDYLVNLLLNNYFFPDTAYKLLGFFENNTALYAIVEQHFISATEKTDLNFLEQFMRANGFQKIRNNDYFNPEPGIILEDLHDGNVLTNNGILYFIDTVFYINQSPVNGNTSFCECAQL